MSANLAVLSTFPPTQCGLATFAQALVAHLQDAGADVGVVSVTEAARRVSPPEVAQVVLGEPFSLSSAAEVLNSFDVAIIQHEYGIYGGRDGADVLDLMSRMRIPIIAVLHTVLERPTPNQYRVLAEVLHRSAASVTMTRTAQQRLVDRWGADPRKLSIIPHGAIDNRGSSNVSPFPRRPSILTWGLLGPGKGIEWALAALDSLAELDPKPLYRVVGQTHPKVYEREGEGYRNTLIDMALRLGVSDLVSFEGAYLSGAELRSVVRDADVVLLPYDSTEQVTSGVMIEAVAAGKPIVSTRFPHAVELLTAGAGLLVPQRDPLALGEALHRVLSDPGLAARMSTASRALAPTVLWPAVADRYLALAARLLAPARRSVA